MSYDISMTDPATGRLAVVAHFTEGGTHALGGTSEAKLNVTYNYSPFYYKHVCPENGIRWLYGRTGAEAAQRLRDAVAKIEAEIPERGAACDNYWTPTAGNAVLPLKRLLAWAEQCPAGVFRGD